MSKYYITSLSHVMNFCSNLVNDEIILAHRAMSFWTHCADKLRDLSSVMWTVTEGWLTNHIGDSSVTNFFFISDCIVPRLFSDIMSADRQLANEIEFDLRKFEEQQEEMERQRLEQLRRRFRGAPVRTLFLLPPATKLGQGNIFSSVCQEFCPRGGGGSAPLHAGFPPAQHMLGDTAGKKRRYVSYWNAILFAALIVKTLSLLKNSISPKKTNDHSW